MCKTQRTIQNNRTGTSLLEKDGPCFVFSTRNVIISRTVCHSLVALRDNLLLGFGLSNIFPRHLIRVYTF